MKHDRLLAEYQELVIPKIVYHFSPVKILITGSRVKGTATKDSDIDVIIVADAFLGVPFIRRMVLVLKSARFKKHVDYFCYTPEEFERIKTQLCHLDFFSLKLGKNLTLVEALQGYQK